MSESQTNSAAAVVSGVTPGVLLKTTRQNQGLSVVDVASRLCLSVQFIEDIERDDYSHMSAKVYARGHVVSYAHLLGVPEPQVTSALNNVTMEFAPIKNNVAMDNERSIPIYQPLEASQQRSSLMLWGSVLVLIILIGLVMMWWKSPSTPDSKAPAAAAPTAISIQPQPAAPPVASPAAAPAAPLPPPAAAPAPAATPAAPAKAPNEPTVLQPSEFRDSRNAAPVALPAPRASNQ